MKHLTNREEEIMEQFWDRGPLFINDILKALGDLKLHIVGKYFNHSYASVLSMFVEEEKISAEEIRELIAQVEAHSQKEKK